MSKFSKIFQNFHFFPNSKNEKWAKRNDHQIRSTCFLRAKEKLYFLYCCFPNLVLFLFCVCVIHCFKTVHSFMYSQRKEEKKLENWGFLSFIFGYQKIKIPRDQHYFTQKAHQNKNSKTWHDQGSHQLITRIEQKPQI